MKPLLYFEGTGYVVNKEEPSREGLRRQLPAGTEHGQQDGPGEECKWDNDCQKAGVRNLEKGVASEGWGRLNIQVIEINQPSKHWHSR